MRSTSLLFGLGALVGVQAYTLTDLYDDSNFFHEFDFFNAPDPTHGFIQYVSAHVANSASLAGFAMDGVYLGLDHTTVNPAGGRPSVRVSSKKSFTKGLVVADIAHMPSSTCGVWPAFWMTAESAWPNKGEIDILEGVNTQLTNAVTLHTGPGCTVTNGGSSVLQDGNCNLNTAFTGCSMKTSAPFGDAFNDVGGGVYALDWTSDAISVWFFPRHAIPADVTSEKPDPASWGTPLSKFVGGAGCDIDRHFSDHKIIFNIATCGDWAGGVWGSNPECTALASSCEAFVGANPGAFTEAYWLINSVKVYQK